MRPLVLLVLVLVAAIGAVPAFSASSSVLAQATPSPLSEQLADCIGGREPTPEESKLLLREDRNEYLAWEGVCRPVAEGEPIAPERLQERIGMVLPEPLKADLDAALRMNPNLAFQPYGVGFQKEWATVPRSAPDEAEKQEAEFMVVVVRQGTFVLDLYTDQEGTAKAIYVWSPGEGIPTMNPWDMSTPKPHYTETGNVLSQDDGSACTQACLVDPEVPVKLQPGDFAIAESGAICSYCLAQTLIDEKDIPILEVYALVDPSANADDFSWVQRWTRTQEEGEQAAARTTDTLTTLGWAFPNLKTGCKDG
ncbi:MAG: hypothetical protein H0T18_01705 [Chloroflexia bacterium]|nr:hypothetical protein [Chloroflexia bacterium]